MSSFRAVSRLLVGHTDSECDTELCCRSSGAASERITWRTVSTRSSQALDWASGGHPVAADRATDFEAWDSHCIWNSKNWLFGVSWPCTRSTRGSMLASAKPWRARSTRAVRSMSGSLSLARRHWLALITTRGVAQRCSTTTPAASASNEASHSSLGEATRGHLHSRLPCAAWSHRCSLVDLRRFSVLVCTDPARDLSTRSAARQTRRASSG
mmetsp:Transcript_20498/g.59873  ORF Transcript_20498/g.59873 Transcript_20498/m.59873 type:complete len:212 (+) Transcript_20498:792-1427(+)